jgi:hypothetical protein
LTRWNVSISCEQSCGSSRAAPAPIGPIWRALRESEG